MDPTPPEFPKCFDSDRLDIAAASSVKSLNKNGTLNFVLIFFMFV